MNHFHRCDHCDTLWQHGEDSQGNWRAHQYPGCGTYVFGFARVTPDQAKQAPVWDGRTLQQPAA